MTAKMDGDKKEAFRKLQEKHLSILTAYGVQFTDEIVSALSILNGELFGEGVLSDEKKRKLFELLMDVAQKHREMLKWSIEERQAFIESIQDDANRPTNVE